jgi:hypothetical protein
MECSSFGTVIHLILPNLQVGVSEFPAKPANRFNGFVLAIRDGPISETVKTVLKHQGTILNPNLKVGENEMEI